MGRLAVFAVVVVLAGSLTLTGEARAHQDDPGPAQNPGDAGTALVFTHTDDVLIADDDGASTLFLRDTETGQDWRLRGGVEDLFGGSHFFRIDDPAGNPRTRHQSGVDGDSWFTGNDDVYINAGEESKSGNLQIATAGGNIRLFARRLSSQTEHPTISLDGPTIVTAHNVGAVAEVLRLSSSRSPQQVFDNDATGAEWFFAMTSDDQFKISRNGTGRVEAKFFDNGNLVIAGALTQNSDAAAKTDLQPADTAAVLDALLAMPVSTWQYRDEPGVTHLGPTAQDFAAAFGLGGSPTGITAVDADGVALAAIQALAADNAELRASNAAQDQLISDLLTDSAAQDHLIAELLADNAELLARIEALEAASG